MRAGGPADDRGATPADVQPSAAEETEDPAPSVPWASEPVSEGDLAELSALVARFVDERDWHRYHAPRNLAAALAVEVAELQELFLWRADEDLLSDKREAVEAEAADVAITLLNFCTRMGIDLGAAVRRKLAEAQAKYPVDAVRGRREKYDEYPHWEDR